MDLSELIQHLMREEGLTEDEAIELAAARMRARRSQGSGGAAMQRSRETSEGVNNSNAQDYAHRVNYGDETPDQARQRWMRQEMEDPNGLFGGGASGGGVFGEGAIVMPDYDPMAVSRELQLRAGIAQVHIQNETLKVLAELRQNQLPPAQPRRLPPEPKPSAFGRLLGRKKRDE